jgi:hypothetical protein
MLGLHYQRLPQG